MTVTLYVKNQAGVSSPKMYGPRTTVSAVPHHIVNLTSNKGTDIVEWGFIFAHNT